METSKYPILFSDQISELKAVLDQYDSNKKFVIIDENTKEHCLPIIAEVQIEFFPIEIKSGEVNKSLSTCEDIWSLLIDNQCSRTDLIINLGGGVIGDLGGFAAACFKRGVKFIQIPTTLLAMVDASVGGKLAVNFKGYKNNIGLFCNPELVYINPVFLKTLNEREIKSGFAEMIKHALISNKELWESLLHINIDKISLSDIHKSVNVKQSIVSQDFKEDSLRKTLNFGHTIGHALESFSLKQDAFPLSHGAAVAAGMLIELKISQLKFNIDPLVYEPIEKFLLNIFGKYDINQLSFEQLINYMLQDKKNKSKDILFVLLKDIGNVVYDQKVTEKEIIEALDHYKNLEI